MKPQEMSSQRPLVSIIMPSLNKGQYIEACIRSVVRQEYSHWEHIVVDGGSLDNTSAILQKYPHLQIISEPDQGMYDAVNKGIKASQGDIVAYLNCDDRYFPYTLSTVVEVFLHENNIDFVYGYCSYIDQSERELFFMRSIPFIAPLIKNMRCPSWSQPTTFWRRSVHDQIGFFDTRYSIVGDGDFFFRMITHGFRGKLIRKKLAQFMYANSFATPKAYLNEQKMIAEARNFPHPLPARCARILGEFVFKVSNLDNYIRQIKRKVRK